MQHSDDSTERDASATFTKHDPSAPADFYEVEAAGLRWLAEAEAGGGVPVVRVLSVTADRIVLRQLHPAAPSAAAAEDFGRRLAHTHRSGAPGFGSAPPGRSGDGYIGPARLPHVPPEVRPPQSWGEFYATYRLRPFARTAVQRGALSAADAHAVERVCERLEGGQLAGPDEPPSRLHGDLWSGNVVFTATGAVLIDPAAHGGHRETDLAMLALFGFPHLDQVLAGYAQVHPLPSGWQRRVALHQLHPLLVHAVLFGSGYGAQAGSAARHYL